MADNGLSALENVAKAAYWEATIAAFFIPNAWSMVAIIYQAQSNPGQLWDAADEWYEVKERLVAADKEVTAQLKALSERDWSGKDRDLFDKKLHDYQNQIRVSYAFAVAVHLTLKIMAMLIAMFIMMMWAFATIIFIYAMIILVLLGLMAIPVLNTWATAAHASVKSQATVITGQLYMILKSAAAGLETFGKGAAATLGGLMAIDVTGQMLTGNTAAYLDFGQAAVNSWDDVAKGHLALLEQKLTGQFMKGKKLGGADLGAIGKYKFPMAKIPKNARPWFERIGGVKGAFDVGVPGAEEGTFPAGGSPTITRPVTGLGEKYGDPFVERTDALPPS
ncbi:hypothetical protein D0T12_31010 [Actinomadura spongiicola]|uniref:Uncharacterized protein n=1 Tax=Actinomadura spongiicola TaxID=2303421 RepID=A0A372G8K9_9ACTN|nr:hypothetical protein [Actinomadura spongiicola]RFS81710.1 hypothetical protein D0T12_31010 [Actinomadura spongiicola]